MPIIVKIISQILLFFLPSSIRDFLVEAGSYLITGILTLLSILFISLFVRLIGMYSLNKCTLLIGNNNCKKADAKFSISFINSLIIFIIPFSLIYYYLSSNILDVLV